MYVVLAQHALIGPNGESDWDVAGGSGALDVVLVLLDRAVCHDGEVLYLFAVRDYCSVEWVRHQSQLWIRRFHGVTCVRH